MRLNRFTWLGITRQFPSFIFYFKENEHGLWRVHAYNYENGLSTFIIETTEAAWRASGMDKASEDDTIAYCEALFETELEGHKLVKNRSIWRQFPTVRNQHWSAGNVVLLGDAAHTAHFSIGSGTKLAMEDAIELASVLETNETVTGALAAYETSRRNDVESTQRAAQVSLEWFENTERIFHALPPLQFAFSLLTRSLRITHENLRLRDPDFVQHLDAWFAEATASTPGVPPMFTPYQLRELKLNNRVVVSPMCMYSAVDGTPNDFHLVHLGSRAVGGTGLLMTEMTNVTRDGRITPGCTGMYKPEHVTAWKRIVDFVHEHSEAAIGIQLGHAGRKGSTKRLWEGADHPLDDGNWEILAPSSVPLSDINQVPIEMNQADLDRTRDAFVAAAQMANTAGFDLIELHCAHGYLLHTFLSPVTNKRTDRYGGNLENRMRFPLEVFKCMRAVWPADKPMVVRISATDWVEDGWDIDESVIFSKALKEVGCDMIDVSSGQLGPESKPEYGRLYQTPFAERIKHEADIPTMTVGNISSYADCNSVLLAGRADLCVIARAHLFDPYWSRHAAFEQSHDTMPWPAQYATMNRYFPRMDWSNRTER
jgi:anthraniloyl-CoA monooxygenase